MRSAVQNGSTAANMSMKAISPTPSSPRLKPTKRQSSTRTVSGTKRKALSLSPTPVLKRAASSAVQEAVEDREASLDEGESQNPELDDGEQATQKRQPVVNSDILPLPWKGRLGFAYFVLVDRR
jgi:UV DNA damage endonuclease